MVAQRDRTDNNLMLDGELVIFNVGNMFGLNEIFLRHNSVVKWFQHFRYRSAPFTAARGS